MTKSEKRERMSLIVDRLKEVYPDATCALEYEGDAWKLMVMGRLSAQCTDARVNMVCKELFTKFPNAEAMAYGSIDEIEEITGIDFFHLIPDDIEAVAESRFDWNDWKTAN